MKKKKKNPFYPKKDVHIPSAKIVIPALIGHSVHHSSSPPRLRPTRLIAGSKFNVSVECAKKRKISPKKLGAAQIQFDDSKREHIDNRFKGAVQIRGFVKSRT
jgi:hypothetical protein